MKARTFSILGSLAGSIAATFLVVGCSSSGGNGALFGGSPAQDACMAGFSGGGAAYVECLRTECPAGLDALETGCASYLACACPGGPYDSTAAGSASCLEQARSSSCEAAAAQPSCIACDGAAASGSGAGGSGSGSGGEGASSGVGSSSGTSSGTGAGSSSGDTGGGSSGDDVDAGSSSGNGSGAGSSSGSDCNVTCTPSTSCDSEGACEDGTPMQSCVSLDSCCNDSCYYMLGGERIECASCETADLEACVQQLYAGCH